jgi:hypothetical protein
MSKLSTVVITLSAILPALLIGASVDAQSTGCNPKTDKPICPSNADAKTASFLDPKVIIEGTATITLNEKVYVAPFALLQANGPISIGKESNVQDNVKIMATGTGVTIGERVILAHGAIVKGQAQIGIGGTDRAATTEPPTNALPETFISFGAEVDGAILEKNTMVNAYWHQEFGS